MTGAEDKPAPAPAPTRATSSQEEEPRRRFMGRDGLADESEPAVVEKGLEHAPAEFWVHIQPATQRLLLVPDLGVAEGEEFTARMMADLQRAGWCEEVAYHAGYDQYWKMPSQESILRAPSLYHIPTPLLNRMKMETKLVKQGEPRGFWLRVRMRSAEELSAGGEHPAA
ncbi:hypothetical protein MA05_15875 [Comamonas aquatica]|nr:hypothetical protein MA05_15875 [Comamonas aquatica]